MVKRVNDKEDKGGDPENDEDGSNGNRNSSNSDNDNDNDNNKNNKNNNNRSSNFNSWRCSESVDVLFASCYWSMSGKNKGFVATPPQGWPGQYVGGCAFVRSWGVRIQKQSKVCSVLILWYSQYLSIKVRMVILIRFWLWWFFCIAFLIFIFFDFQYLLSFLHHTYMWKVQFHAFIHVWCV